MAQGPDGHREGLGALALGAVPVLGLPTGCGRLWELRASCGIPKRDSHPESLFRRREVLATLTYLVPEGLCKAVKTQTWKDCLSQVPEGPGERPEGLGTRT